MPKDIRVLLVEDDPYARDLMALLLTRDWRTQVIGELGNKEQVMDFFTQTDRRLDLVVLDSEHPQKPDWPATIAGIVRELAEPPVIVLTGTLPDLETLKHALSAGFGGYLIKGEILYALATAVAQAMEGHFVTTPGVRQIAPRRVLPLNSLILDGRKTITHFTRRENDLVRLGIIFNLALRDIADELVLSPGWVSEIVSTVYQKLGMREILTGEIPLEEIFTDEAVLARFRKIADDLASAGPGKGFRKAPWMATLAFHLLTQPFIETV